MRFFLLLLPLSISAFLPQIKISYFKPALPTNKEVFNVASAEYQIEALYHLQAGINVFANGSYISHPKAEGVRLFPVTFGVKYVRPVARLISLYGYGGPRIYYFQQSGVAGLGRSKFSGAFGAGFMTYMSRHWCLDTFGEWAMSSPVAGTNPGGWNAGTGFSYIF